MMLTALIAPLVFLFLDVPPLVGVTPASAMFYLVPMVVAQVGGIVLLGGGRYYPLAAQVLGTFQSFRLLPVILKTLVRPHGHAFKVTPKGADAAGGGVEGGIFIAAVVLMLLTFAGLVINAMPDWRIVAQGALVPMVAFWCGINIVVLFLAAMLCLGMPAKRGEERFTIDEPVALRRIDSNVVWMTRGINLSLSGIALAVEGLPNGEKVKVRIRGVGILVGVVARGCDGLTGIAFTGERDVVRDRLIIRLFTAGRNTAVLRVAAWQATQALLLRIWTADMQTAQVAAAANPGTAAEKLSAMTRVIDPQVLHIRRRAAMGG